jgi:MFS family permease
VTTAQAPGFAGFLRNNAAWIGVGFLITLTSSFGQTFFISIFAGEIRAEFGLSHGEWGGVYALATTSSAIVMIWAGVLTDHFRVRVLAPASLVSLAVACLTLAVAPSVVWLVLAVFLLRFSGQGMLAHISAVAMARWFVAQRGRALSIANMGYGVGEATLPLLFVGMMGLINWRYLWLGAAMLALMMAPVIRAMMRHERTPQSIAESHEAVGMEGRHWSRGQTLRHPLFWLTIPTIAGISAVLTALFFHQVHLAAEKGWSHAGFVALFPLYTVAGIAVMLTAGWAVDRMGTARLAPWLQIPFALGALVLWGADTLWMAAVGMALIGAGHGSSATIMTSFWAEFFGTRHLGAIKALAAAIMVLGSAIGPGLTGIWIDWGVSFPNQLPVIAVWFVVASALLTLGISRARRLGFAA